MICHTCRNLYLILITLLLVETKGYDITQIFGDEFGDFGCEFGESRGGYFKSFDIVFGGLNGNDGSSQSCLRGREVAQYTFHDKNDCCSNSNNSEGLISSSNKTDDSNSVSKDKTNPFWRSIQDSSISNITSVIVINLEILTALPGILNDIRNLIAQFGIQGLAKVTPYFIITWQNPLTPSEEEGIRSHTEFASGFEMDTDIYFTFLQCITVSPNDSKNNSTNNCTDTTSNLIHTPSCPSGSGRIRMLEFFSVKNEAFIQPVDLKSCLVLSQKVIRRTNLNNASLSVVAAYGYPFRANFSADNNSFEGGYEADQIKFLGQSYNLSIKVGIGTGWISESNITLHGMGAQIINNEADTSISASEVLPYRAARLTFLHPSYYTKMWGFFVQPPSSSFRDIFLHAFTGDLWLTMFSTWTLIVLAMFALSIVKRKLDTMHENDTILMQELIIWAAGAVCQQGWHICPESTCMKIIFIFALITGLVSYVAYSAALVSILSVKVIPIKSLDDIVNRGYVIYQDNQTINSKYVIEKLESEGLIPCLDLEQRSLRSEVALPKVLSSFSAFIGASDFFYPVARDKMNDTVICNSISRVPITGRPVPGGMFIRKGSPFRDFFNHRLLIMYERGIRFRLLETYFRQSAVMCLEKSGATKDPLGFNDVYTAFVILLLGYCLSFLILVVERIFPPNYYGGVDNNFCSNALATITQRSTSGFPGGKGKRKDSIGNF